MKRIRLTTLYLLLLCFCSAQGRTRIVFTPTWTPQAQFAGYYMALEKGFFKEEGVDVTIRHLKANTKKTPCDMLEDGDCNVVCISLMKALLERDNGRPLINILQTSQNASLLCVSPDPLKNLHSLNGKKLGTWKTGYREIADMALYDSKTQVQWVPFLYGVNLFVAKAVDATLCCSYNEYVQLVMARGSIPSNHIISFAQIGYNYPEDGVYVTEDFYNRHRPEIVAFVRACKKGWQYCRAHPDEAIEVVMRYTKANNIVTNRFHQRMMLAEILRLQQDPSSAWAYKPGISTFAPVSPSTFKKALENLRKIGRIKGEIKYEDMIKPVKH